MLSKLFGGDAVNRRESGAVHIVEHSGIELPSFRMEAGWKVQTIMLFLSLRGGLYRSTYLRTKRTVSTYIRGLIFFSFALPVTRLMMT